MVAWPQRKRPRFRNRGLFRIDCVSRWATISPLSPRAPDAPWLERGDVREVGFARCSLQWLRCHNQPYQLNQFLPELLVKSREKFRVWSQVEFQVVSQLVHFNQFVLPANQHGSKTLQPRRCRPAGMGGSGTGRTAPQTWPESTHLAGRLSRFNSPPHPPVAGPEGEGNTAGKD